MLNKCYVNVITNEDWMLSHNTLNYGEYLCEGHDYWQYY